MALSKYILIATLVGWVSTTGFADTSAKKTYGYHKIPRKILKHLKIVERRKHKLAKYRTIFAPVPAASRKDSLVGNGDSIWYATEKSKPILVGTQKIGFDWIGQLLTTKYSSVLATHVTTGSNIIVHPRTWFQFEQKSPSLLGKIKHGSVMVHRLSNRALEPVSIKLANFTINAPDSGTFVLKVSSKRGLIRKIIVCIEGRLKVKEPWTGGIFEVAPGYQLIISSDGTKKYTKVPAYQLSQYFMLYKKIVPIEMLNVVDFSSLVKPKLYFGILSKLISSYEPGELSPFESLIAADSFLTIGLVDEARYLYGQINLPRKYKKYLEIRKAILNLKMNRLKNADEIIRQLEKSKVRHRLIERYASYYRSVLDFHARRYAASKNGFETLLDRNESSNGLTLSARSYLKMLSYQTGLEGTATIKGGHTSNIPHISAQLNQGQVQSADASYVEYWLDPTWYNSASLLENHAKWGVRLSYGDRSYQADEARRFDWNYSSASWLWLGGHKKNSFVRNFKIHIGSSSVGEEIDTLHTGITTTLDDITLASGLLIDQKERVEANQSSLYFRQRIPLYETKLSESMTLDQILTLSQLFGLVPSDISGAEYQLAYAIILELLFDDWSVKGEAELGYSHFDFDESFGRIGQEYDLSLGYELIEHLSMGAYTRYLDSRYMNSYGNLTSSDVGFFLQGRW